MQIESPIITIGDKLSLIHISEYYRIKQAEYKAMYEDASKNGETKFERSKLEGKCLDVYKRQVCSLSSPTLNSGLKNDRLLFYVSDVKGCLLYTSRCVKRQAFEVTKGSVTFYGKNLLELSPEDRSHEGI